MKTEKVVFLGALKACGAIGSLKQVMAVHKNIINNGLELNNVIGSGLVHAYAKCGSLEEARKVFDKAQYCDRVLWSTMVTGYSHHKDAFSALDLFMKMQQNGIDPDNFVFSSIMKSCSSMRSIEQGRLIHDQVMNNAMEQNAIIGTTVVDMYMKCGSLQEAHGAFNRLPVRDATSWSAIIAGYAEYGDGSYALNLFREMQQHGIKPDKVVFLSILKACDNLQDIGHARLIHDQIMENKLEQDVVIASTLVDVYAKCESLEEALKVFDNLKSRNVVSWNALIAGYAQHGYGHVVMDLFVEMRQEGLNPGKVTYLNILKAYSSIKAIEHGRLLHEHVIQVGFLHDIGIITSIMDMYAKCGSLYEARDLFDRMSNRNSVSCGVMITGYVQRGLNVAALELFYQMQEEGVKPEKATFLSILKACGNMSTIKEGTAIHDLVLESGLEKDTFLGNALIDMYIRCGSLEEAHRVFDRLPNKDVVTWGVMISGYVSQGHYLCAMDLYDDMLGHGIRPDAVTFFSLLKACSIIGDVDQGRLIHGQIIKYGFEGDIAVGTALIDMYVKCEALEDAHSIFDSLSSHNVVSWSALIGGYAMNGHAAHALQLFKEMQEEGVQPNEVTFLSALKACGTIGAMEQGRMIHEQIVKSGLEWNTALGNTLIDMYGKCGRLDVARKVFDKLQNEDVISWDAMFAAYARYGDTGLARRGLEDMQQKGIRPDDASFTNILATCSHAGSVDEGCQYFQYMTDTLKITPNINHYNCLIDLFGRAGWLSEAEVLLHGIGASAIGWTSLLTACRTYGNVGIGRVCFDYLIQLQPEDGAAYVLMSDIYSDAHMWEEASRFEETRKSIGAWKKPGKAWIEIKQKVHEFIVGDKTHPQIDDINTMLRKLNKRMKNEGYVPQFRSVSMSMSTSEKEDALCGHSEKMAIAFGLLSTPQGMTIRATKNLRICIDCHNATKIISKIERREIIIRDAYRFHHFKDGSCSCQDYN